MEFAVRCAYISHCLPAWANASTLKGTSPLLALKSRLPFFLFPIVKVACRCIRDPLQHPPAILVNGSRRANCETANGRLWEADMCNVYRGFLEYLEYAIISRQRSTLRSAFFAAHGTKQVDAPSNLVPSPSPSQDQLHQSPLALEIFNHLDLTVIHTCLSTPRSSTSGLRSSLTSTLKVSS